MKKLLVILGPTATGKTDFALSLAKKFNGELVACDSRQVYEGLDIGTGKLPAKNSKFEIRNSKFKKANGRWGINGVKIWMYDVVSLEKQYSVDNYVKDANKAIADIIKIGKMPIVVGGTGLYLRALLDGLFNLEIPIDDKLREELNSLNKEQLQKKLQNISPQKWDLMNQSDRANPRRLIRAIELNMKSNLLNEQDFHGPISIGPRNDVLKVGLTAPREYLYKKIDSKVYEWIQEGIVNEIESLIKKGITKERISNLGLEYRVVIEYLDKQISFEQMIKTMQEKTRQYSKRQLVWFKNPKVCKEPINWFDITKKNCCTEIENLVAKWYDSHNGAKN